MLRRIRPFANITRGGGCLHQPPTAGGLLLFSSFSLQSTATATMNTTNNNNNNNWFLWVRDSMQQQHRQKISEKAEAAAEQPKPPEWFQRLCEDLHFRRDSAGDEGDKLAIESAGEMTTQMMMRDNGDEKDKGAAGEGEIEVDPFLWLDFKVFPEEEYRFESFEFPQDDKSVPFPPEVQDVLVGGGGSSSRKSRKTKTMMCFATGYKFPDRRQLPVTVGTEPCYLWIDPESYNNDQSSSDQPPAVVYIQLGRHFPPAMWLPVKATSGARAIRRVLSEFATTAAVHRDRHEEYWDRRWRLSVNTMKKQGGANSNNDNSNKNKLMDWRNPGHVLRFISFASSKEFYDPNFVRGEYHNSQEFFMGEYDDPEQFQLRVDLCPTLFSTPTFRTNVNIHDPDFAPTPTGPGVATSLYRTVFSKSLLLVQVHLATEVKLPPLDLDAFKLLWSDTSRVAPPSKIPIFIRAIWPDNKRMCGGGSIARVLNHKLATEFAHDVPVDVLYSLLYLAHWAKKPQEFLGVHGMRGRMLQLEDAILNSHHNNIQQQEEARLLSSSSSSSKHQQDENNRNPFLVVRNQSNSSSSSSSSSYPSTAEISSPHYTLEEQLGMHIQYCAHLNDPLAADTIRHYMRHPNAAVRLGCAKAAMELGDRTLFKKIVEAEPEGRMRRVMVSIVRKRKARDLTDPEPHTQDDSGQFEFPPPLWSGASRIDPTTTEGRKYLARSKMRGPTMHKGYKGAVSMLEQE